MPDQCDYLRALLSEQKRLDVWLGAELVRLIDVEGVARSEVEVALGRSQQDISRRLTRGRDRVVGGRLGGRLGDGPGLDALLSAFAEYESMPARVDAEIVRVTSHPHIAQADVARALGVTRQAVSSRVQRHRRRQAKGSAAG